MITVIPISEEALAAIVTNAGRRRDMWAGRQIQPDEMGAVGVPPSDVPPTCEEEADIYVRQSPQARKHASWMRVTTFLMAAAACSLAITSWCAPGSSDVAD